jgi:hypothetical protein
MSQEVDIVMYRRIRTAQNRKVEKEVEVLEASYERKKNQASLKIDCRDFVWPINWKEYRARDL